ncbi:carbonic anhydrase [bacterium]|nr:carbonic anhydrase [bacterium]
METYKRLLLANKAWAQEKTTLKPSYFRELAVDQRPDFLWIGCSDSRVPAEEVTGTQPGEIFVHRNIANLVIHTDFNLLSVVQYAVDYLKVRHIIVCGHYGCGGVRAAMTHQRFGLLNKWLRCLKDTYELNQNEIESLPDDTSRTNRLVELNVRQQIKNLAKTSIIQSAWKREQRPLLHGWVFGLDSGLLHPLQTMGPGDPLPDIFRYDLDD